VIQKKKGGEEFSYPLEERGKEQRQLVNHSCSSEAAPAFHFEGEKKLKRTIQFQRCSSGMPKGESPHWWEGSPSLRKKKREEVFPTRVSQKEEGDNAAQHLGKKPLMNFLPRGGKKRSRGGGRPFPYDTSLRRRRDWGGKEREVFPTSKWKNHMLLANIKTSPGSVKKKGKKEDLTLHREKGRERAFRTSILSPKEKTFSISIKKK